jgi:Flp pilus assembly pilin Flp
MAMIQSNKSRKQIAIRSLFDDTRGLSTVEYVIVLVLIAAVAMGAWNKFGGDVSKRLKSAHTEFNKQVKLPK